MPKRNRSRSSFRPAKSARPAQDQQPKARFTKRRIGALIVIAVMACGLATGGLARWNARRAAAKAAPGAAPEPRPSPAAPVLEKEYLYAGSTLAATSDPGVYPGW